MLSRTQLATASAILVTTVVPSLMLYAHSRQSHPSPMARLEAIFAAARPAKRAQLNGNWILVTDVYIKPALDGQSGPNYVLTNEKGIRNSDIRRQSKNFSSDNPQQIYWKLTFRHVRNRVQAVTRSAFAPWGDAADVGFDANGDFTFAPDFGAEGDFTYKCRMATATRLVCLFKNGGGEGLEFQKSAD